MDKERIKSCINTIEALQRLAYNIYGHMDVIESENCETIKALLAQQAGRSEEPKRQTGEWLPNVIGVHNYSCNVCGNPVKYRANFCDCCGADMRESNITEALVKEFYPNT